jgi:hypothetical protein
MITHTFALEDFSTAIALLEGRRENVFKIMLRVNE